MLENVQCVQRVVLAHGYSMVFCEESGVNSLIAPVLFDPTGDTIKAPEFITVDSLGRAYSNVAEDGYDEERDEC